VRIAGDRGSVQVLVEDQGPGLTAAVRARLFQPHVTTKEQGAGLGLFLAERIARRRYGGSLVLADRQPRGLRAVLTLRDAVPSAHAV
jgi:C4-dicarboxylate-specific signal transduction histidine kinase